MIRMKTSVSGLVLAVMTCTIPVMAADNPVAKMISSASGIEKMFLFMAVPATVLFLIMSILTFVGFGDHGADGDVDGTDMHGESFSDTFHLFTIRNFIVFFMMFGWAGLAMLRSGSNSVAAVLVAAVIGAAMIFLVSYLFFVVAKLAHSGNIPVQSAIGATGSVYLTIPAHRSGQGKVQVVVEGSKIELKAMTDGEKIATGESVTVRELSGGDIVIVDKA